jgi:hypothetical protein
VFKINKKVIIIIHLNFILMKKNNGSNFKKIIKITLEKIFFQKITNVVSQFTSH